jgi:hypothetical protein
VADIGCWVVKSQTAPADLVPGWAPGAWHRLTRCLRRSYRVGLMEAGQPCLLWLSGPRHPGVHAIGRLQSGERPRPGSGGGPTEVAVDVELRLLTEPVPRSELLADPVTRMAEVLRMPAGSNPSYLSPSVWAVLVEHLDPSDRAAAGW